MDTTLRPRWALITGASAGIGAAIAHELALRGCNLVLSARRTERLQSLAEELSTKFSIRCEWIAADLSEVEAPQRLCAEIARRDLLIDVLINNAGYGVSGYFQTKPWKTHAEFLQVMVTAPCELTWLLLPSMQARGYGRIGNVASLAGLVPGSAGATLYAAAKSFLIKFSQSLALENSARGINVCAICPGFTYSEFHDVNGARALVSKMPRWMWMSASEVARIGVDALERGEIVCVTGRMNRLIKSAMKLLPDGYALRSMQKRSKKFRVQPKSD